MAPPAGHTLTGRGHASSLANSSVSPKGLGQTLGLQHVVPESKARRIHRKHTMAKFRGGPQPAAALPFFDVAMMSLDAFDHVRSSMEEEVGVQCWLGALAVLCCSVLCPAALQSIFVCAVFGLLLAQACISRRPSHK